MTQIAQKSLRDYLQETEDAISKGRMDDAESKCQLILAQFPESLEAQRLLGEVYLAKGSLEEAQQAFDWVLTNDPENIITYCDRALISERQGDYDTALDCYQQAYELSHGNSKIRHLFNKLSQKAGQQGFMLSRAGLARLYMRGDLLTQAIQEWEAVLSTTPDRLDARTGLLETYWREGLYDRVSQLASQILEDVPGCEKALLLLSYVTSLKSTPQAQDLIRRVEALDPDLLMAQDLFSDLLASQPAEPFLDLLKKPPVVLSASPTNNQTSLSSLEDVLRQSSSTLKSEPSATTWESLQNASSSQVDATYHITPDVRQQSPALSTWSDSPTFNDLPWSEFAVAGSDEEHSLTSIGSGASTPQNGSVQPETHFSNRFDQQEEAVMEHPEAQPEPWEALQDALTKVNAEGGSLSSLSPEIWATLDKYLQTSNIGREENPLLSRESISPQDQMTPIVAEEPSSSGTPSWMSSLQQPSSQRVSGALNDLGAMHQQNERSFSSPLNSASSSLPMNQGGTPSSSSAAFPTPQEPTLSNTAPAWQNYGESTGSELSSATDEEDSLFGPAWLRSLGAAAIEDEQATTDEKNKIPTLKETIAPAEPKPQYETWSPTPQQAEESSWTSPMNGSSAKEVPEIRNTASPTEEPSWMSSLQPAPQAQQAPSELSWMDTLRQSSEPSWLSSLQPVGEPSWMDALQQGTETKTDFSSSQQYEATSGTEKDRDNWSGSFGTVPETDWKSSIPSYTAGTNWASSGELMPQSPSQEPQDDPLLATLKELEQGLLAQGFVPLEPNSLSSLAQQEEQRSSVPEPIAPTRLSEETMPRVPIEPSLSSALAQLGGYGSLPESPAKENEQTHAASAGTPEISVPATYQQRSVHNTAPEPVEQKLRTPQPTYTATSPGQPTYNGTSGTRPANPTNNIQRAPEMQMREEPPANLHFKPTTGPVPISQSPMVHINPLLDSELETTMKRPAIRLQPMPTRTEGAKEQVASSANTRSRASITRGSELGLTNQERLIAGYQHQLVGDYDEAMQEYRIIIRNAPNLLNEVISNVRALLKLAPKYAAGYRVLGDAYMRQGEYLQAMESYNKALTMAKKKA